MLNALDHGWGGLGVPEQQKASQVNQADMRLWNGGSGIGGSTVTTPAVATWWPNCYPAGHCTKLPQDSYLCDDGEVVVDGVRYYWENAVGAWCVVLDTPDEDVADNTQ